MGQILVNDENRAAVLAALYNASKPQGMGFLQYDPKPMTEDEAAGLLSQQSYFDYLNGRVMKVDMYPADGVLRTGGYDRDNGDGAAERAWEAAQAGDSATIEQTHRDGTAAAAEAAKGQMAVRSEFKDGVLTLGLGDVAEQLTPAIDAALEANEE